MSDITYAGGGTAMIIVGMAWIVGGTILGTDAATLYSAAILASVGVIVVGFAPIPEDEEDDSENMALDAEDLE